MGVKYTIPFRAHDNVSWRVDISTASYSGDPISVRGSSQQCAKLAYDSEETDDPFSAFIHSTVTCMAINEGQIDVNELQQAQDRDFTLSVYRNDSLRWEGFVVPDGIQQPFKAPPYVVEFQAICGLSMLDDMPYIHADLPGVIGSFSRCPMNYIRQILFANLGIPLPVRWSNVVQNTFYEGEDTFIGSTEWAADNEGFYSYQSGNNGTSPGPIQSCGYILRGILLAFQCRIYQSNGIWKIRRVNDIADGLVNYIQIGSDLGIMSPQGGQENVTKHIGIGGYGFIEEDAVITVRQGLKTCKVTYNANIRENILPNGNQDDIFEPILNQKPIHWGGYAPTEPDFISVPRSLDGRSGYSTELTGLVSTLFYTMISDGGSLYFDGLPLDTKTLVKRINFGFIFSPSVFPTTGTPENLIDWSSSPMQLQVILNFFGTRYYLNDFGYWQSDPATITITVDGMRLNDVAQINFDKFQGIIMPEPPSNPIAGNQSDLQIVFFSKSGTVYSLDNISITIDSGNDVYESTFADSRNTTTDDRELQISSSFSGYMLSNFMTSPFMSDQECFFTDGFYTGTLTGLTANAIMRYRYKSSRVFNGSVNTRNKDWSFDEIYNIDTLSNAKFLPLNANYNIEKCETSIVAMECRNETPILVEKYYSSNDQPLSN